MNNIINEFKKNILLLIQNIHFFKFCNCKLIKGFDARARYFDCVAVGLDVVASLLNFFFFLPVLTSLFKVGGII